MDTPPTHLGLSQWSFERVQRNGGRMRKTSVVALARKLLLAFWKYVTSGVVIEGAVAGCPEGVGRDARLDRRGKCSPPARLGGQIRRWCPRSGSNRHSSRNRILNPARLPIPPQGPLALVTPAHRARAICAGPHRALARRIVGGVQRRLGQRRQGGALLDASSAASPAEARQPSSGSVERRGPGRPRLGGFKMPWPAGPAPARARQLRDD